MGGITSLIILLVAMLIQAFLQLGPGTFLIFYHNALGTTSRKKADDRALSFILGYEICIALMFLLTYIMVILVLSVSGFNNRIFLYVLSGVFFVLSFFMLLFYFKKSANLQMDKNKRNGNLRAVWSTYTNKNSTKLFLPRRTARNLMRRAETAKTRSDTVVLGMATATIELPFSLPLYIICSLAIFTLAGGDGAVFIFSYIITALIPLFIIRTLLYNGRGLAEIQKFRALKKNFFRIFLFLCYLILAVVTLITGVYG